MKPGSFGLAALHILARSFFSIVALAAIIWGGYFLPLFARQAPPHRVALAYSQGRGFSNQTLVQEAQLAEEAGKPSFCNSIQLHDVVVLRLAVLYDASSTGSQASIAESREALYGAIRRSLSCAPSDAFVWLALFWLDVSSKGFKPEDASYLRLSYATGPNEGWISLRRIRPALSTFAWLPPDVSDDAVDEFVKLVDTGRLYPQMVDIFASAALTVQSRIIERFKTEDLISRQSFARALYNSGLDVDVPGVDPPAHPWR